MVHDTLQNESDEEVLVHTEIWFTECPTDSGCLIQNNVTNITPSDRTHEFEVSLPYSPDRQEKGESVS